MTPCASTLFLSAFSAASNVSGLEISFFLAPFAVFTPCFMNLHRSRFHARLCLRAARGGPFKGFLQMCGVGPHDNQTRFRSTAWGVTKDDIVFCGGKLTRAPEESRESFRLFSSPAHAPARNIHDPGLHIMRDRWECFLRFGLPATTGSTPRRTNNVQCACQHRQCLILDIRQRRSKPPDFFSFFLLSILGNKNLLPVVLFAS